jgi:hypothetical protein
MQVTIKAPASAINAKEWQGSIVNCLLAAKIMYFELLFCR